MKTLGFCFVLLPFTLAIGASAQEPSNAPRNPEKAAFQKSLVHSEQFESPKFENDNLILATDDLQPTCVYMRTYRMKREARDSDAVRPAGYTTCVPIARFGVKRAVVAPISDPAEPE